MFNVPTEADFCKPRLNCIPNVPFQDTGTWRSKLGHKVNLCTVHVHMALALLLSYRITGFHTETPWFEC